LYQHERGVRLGGKQGEAAGLSARCRRRGGMLMRRSKRVNPRQLHLRDMLDPEEASGGTVLVCLMQCRGQEVVRGRVVAGFKRLTVECDQSIKHRVRVAVLCHQEVPSCGGVVVGSDVVLLRSAPS
jgi:hypothetical protein